MHTTMSNLNYEKNWKRFLKCKECWKIKEVNDENRYKHKEWFLGVLWRCKECIKKWRRSEKERIMARKRDRDRYYNNPERRMYIFKSDIERRERKWYRYIHQKASRWIRKLNIRPEKCPFCRRKARIVAHHYDYSKPLSIVFCCDICHSKIHHNIIKDISKHIVDLDSFIY